MPGTNTCMLGSLDPTVKKSLLAEDTSVRVVSVLNVSSSQEQQRGKQAPDTDDEERVVPKTPVYKYVVQDLAGNSAFLIALSHSQPWRPNSQVVIPKNAEIWRGIILQ